MGAALHRNVCSVRGHRSWRLDSQSGVMAKAGSGSKKQEDGNAKRDALGQALGYSVWNLARQYDQLHVSPYLRRTPVSRSVIVINHSADNDIGPGSQRVASGSPVA